VSERLDRTLTDPAGFRHWTPVGIRFRDLDLLGHVNNANLVGWLEDGRVALELPIQPLTADYAGPVLVLAELRVEYREEIRFGMEVRVGTRVQRIGRTSVTLGQTVMADDRCAAIAEVVEVLIDAKTRRPMAMPAEFRSLFEQHLAPVAS